MTFPFYDYDSDFFSTEDLLFLAGASGKAVEDTATGNPLVFTTDLSKPLKSLLIPFTPIQSGTGDPSPSNIRSILPWNGLTVNQCGKNLADFVDGKGIASDGTIGDSAYRTATVNPIDIKSGASYVFTFESGFDGIYSVFNGDTLVRRTGANNGQTLDTSGGNKLFVCVYKSGETATVENSSPMVRVSTAPEGYEPYKPITDTDIVFPSPVYGGTLDVVSGVLTVQRVGIIKKWKDGTIPSVGASYTRKTFDFNVPVKSVSTNAYQRCNVAPKDWSTDAKTHFYIDENKAYLWLPNDTDGELDVQFVAVLVTPQEITLTPAQITAIVGDNTIWSDADGQMTAVYLKKG